MPKPLTTDAATPPQTAADAALAALTPNPDASVPGSYALPQASLPETQEATLADARLEATRKLALEAVQQEEKGEQPPDERQHARSAREDQDAARKAVATEKQRLLAEESKLQRERAAEVAAAKEAGARIPPQRASRLDFYSDPSAMLDKDGLPAGQAGTVKRRIRATDENGRPSARRLNEFRRSGYTVIKSRVDQEPLIDELGIWAECPVPQEALRRAAAEREVVSLGEIERSYQARSREAGFRGFAASVTDETDVRLNEWLPTG